MAVYIRNAYAVQAIQVTPDNQEETSAFIRGYGLFSYSPGDWLVNAAGMPTQVYSDAEFKARFSAPYVAIAAPRIDSLPTVAAPLELRDGRAWAGDHDVTAAFDVVVAVHSHAPVDATRAACKPGGVIVSLPCCVAWPLDRGETWVDDRVLSPDRRFVVEVGAP